MLYHKRNFIFNDTISGASLLDQDVEMTSPPASPPASPGHTDTPTELTLFGSGGEDKLVGGQGERQAI